MDRFEAAIDTDGQRLFEGLLFLVLYCLTIPAADYLTTHVGYICEPGGPCKIPIAPGIMSTSGAIAIGFTFVLRDFIQRRFGIAVSACAVVMGASLAGFLAPPSLVVASGTGILVAGFVDLLVYTVLVRKNFVAAVVASSIVSSMVDSAIFLWLAFSSLDLLIGQTLAKTWVILAVLPLTWWLWKRDMRIGLAAA